MGLFAVPSERRPGGRRDAGPPLVSRLVCGSVRNACRKPGGRGRDAEPPLVHRLVCGLIRGASGKSGERPDTKPPLVNRLVHGLISLFDHRNQSVSTR